MIQLLAILGSALLLWAAGCQHSTPHLYLNGEPQPPYRKTPLTELTAHFTTEPINLDGKLDEEFWKQAPVYQMNLSEEEAQKNPMKEGGEVRLAWDKDYLYVGTKFIDSDILAQGTADNQEHYLMGDLAEVFLRPANRAYYWELYVTPKGHRTSFWFWMRGNDWRPLYVDEKFGLKVAAHVVGTLNKSDDKDQYWTGEMAIPLRDLQQYGDPIGPEHPWRILVARYNYVHPIVPNKPMEMTSCPQMPKGIFHAHEDYGVLRLVK